MFHLNEPLPRYWMTRMYLAANVLYATLLAICSTDTLLHRVIFASGEKGEFALELLAVVAVLALVDCVVNDLMPRKYVFPFVLRHRHTLYMLMAIGLVSLVYITMVSSGPSAIHLFLLLHALFATFVAFFDLLARHNK